MTELLKTMHVWVSSDNIFELRLQIADGDAGLGFVNSIWQEPELVQIVVPRSLDRGPAEFMADKSVAETLRADFEDLFIVLATIPLGQFHDEHYMERVKSGQIAAYLRGQVIRRLDAFGPWPPGFIVNGVGQTIVGGGVNRPTGNLAYSEAFPSPVSGGALVDVIDLNPQEQDT